MHECINAGSNVANVGSINLYLSDQLLHISHCAFGFNFTMRKIGVWDTYNHRIIDVNDHQARFGNKLNYIGYNAFQNCASLNDFIIPNSVQTMERDCFVNVPVERLVVPFVGRDRNATQRSDNSENSNSVGILNWWFQNHDWNWYNSADYRDYYYWVLSYYDINGGNRWFSTPTTLRTVIVTDQETLQFGAFYDMDNITKVILPFGQDAHNTNTYVPEEYDLIVSELMTKEWLDLYRR